MERLLQGGYKTTPDERRKISAFLECALPDVGDGIHLVGWILDKEHYNERQDDRRIVRVIGPGSLV